MVMTTDKDWRENMLEIQGEDPAIYTHFDCWGDNNGMDDVLWDEMDAQAVELAGSIAGQCANDLGADITGLDYMAMGAVVFFDKLAERVAMAGFKVYVSDTCFEVYP